MYPQKEITKTGDKVFLPFALTCHITRPKRATLLRVIAVMVSPPTTAERMLFSHEIRSQRHLLFVERTAKASGSKNFIYLLFPVIFAVQAIRKIKVEKMTTIRLHN
jgi:hypothetical protein